MQTDTSIINLNTSLIVPNKYQPRKVFDDTALDSLAESIRTHGIINPILVRKKEDKYEIIAGERRYRAAKKIGLTEVPVIVKNADEQQMAELALIENIQRQGLSPIEEAKSYEEIMRIGNQTQEKLAERLGKSQSAIANKIRLLSLPQEIQDALANKKISERHARSLITVKEKEKQLELLDRIINEKLTVKETEQIIKTKEISEDEIKQAISDIMKSLNLTEEEEEEKEDDNMNNGNFFPNYDNNNGANANASLNMMNMQSINQGPVAPEPEVVMPTIATPVQEPQLGVPTPPPVGPTLEPVGAPTPDLNMNNGLNSMAGFGLPQDTLTVPTMPPVDQPMINDAPLFGPQPSAPSPSVEPQMSMPMMDEPLFNPNLTIPTPEPVVSPTVMPEPTPMEQPLVTPEPPLMAPNSFEVPVSTSQAVETQPVNRLVELQNLLTANGYTYKTYSNATDDCLIIELPKN